MKGTLFIIGMGPGDPELITKKAENCLHTLSIIAYFCKKNEIGHARQIASPYLIKTPTELRFEYPITTEISHHTADYKKTLTDFYNYTASVIQQHLDKGNDIGLLCEGDPLLYGSAIYILEILQKNYSIEIIPGISAMSGCWNRLQLPIVRNHQTLTVLPATLPLDVLLTKLKQCEATVLMKIGRNLTKIKSALKETNLLEQAVYIERVTQSKERILPLVQLQSEQAPYFSLILIARQDSLQ